MNADDFLDAPSADEFLGDAELAAPASKGRQPSGRGFSLRPAKRPQSVLQQPGNAQNFADAPDPRANAVALFNALQNNPALVNSPMYQAGAGVLQDAATPEPNAVQRTITRNRAGVLNRQQREREIIAAREGTDEAFGGPVGQAIAAPARRLTSGVAQVVGGVASIPQLFGSDLGRETAETAEVMARANMPEDPGIADEILAGAGQILPMVGGAGAIRAAALPFMGDAAATGLATSLSGAAGGAMTGGEVLRDLRDRPDLGDDEATRRAMAAAVFSGLTGKYADRFLIPGADRAASGVMQAGGRAFLAEGAQEGLDQMGQNVATDRAIAEGVARAALVGGIVGGGTRAATEVDSDATQLARAIDADADALAGLPPTAFTPEARVAAAPPAPASTTPSAEEFLADAAPAPAAPEAQPAPAITAESAAQVEARPEIEPAMEQRLLAAGWQPPKDTNAEPAAAPLDQPATATPDPVAAQARPPVEAVPARDGADRADGLRPGAAVAELSELQAPRETAGAPEIRRSSEKLQVVQGVQGVEEPAFSRSAMASVDANVRRGRDAMNRALLDRADQNRAMFRTGMGWVDFVYGDENKGIAHILRRRGAEGMDAERMLTQEMVDTIAKGEEIRRSEVGPSVRAVLRHGNHEAVMVRRQGSNTWLLTGFERVSDGEGRGATPSSSTQPGATRSRPGQGADTGESVQPDDRPEVSDKLDARPAAEVNDPQFRRGPAEADFDLNERASTADTMRSELRERFGELADRLEKRGILKVWDSVDAYNEAAGQGSFRLPDDARGVQGMYSGGVAHLFGDGVEPGKAVGVFLHEVGEHASMKAMLGPRYKDLVRRAYQLVSDGDEIAETAMERIPEDTPDKFYDSELLAYMIEETANREQQASPAARSWLRDIVAAIRAWFFQSGLSKQLERFGVKLDLTPKDIAALAVRAAEWQAQQSKPDRETASDAPVDIELSKRQPFRATGSNPFAGQLFGPQPWTVAEPGTWDNVVRTLQNNKVDLKRVRDAIEQRFGRLPDTKDAYLQEELYHGKVAARVEKLHADHIEPILRKIVVAGKNAGVTLDDVNRYLHARHAPERNAAMAAINPTLPNNQVLSGMSDADAAKVLADFGSAGKTAALQAIAKDIDQLLADTRTNLVADGLEDAGVVQAWEQAYQHYVPLMRDIEDRPAKGSGFSVKGPEAKRAMGSNRQVVDILANIVTQAETAAIRAEKAEVGRALLAMAKQYPNADFWKVDTPPAKPRINPNTGLVERSAVDPLYQTADNVLMVKDYGAIRFIVFNKGNERAMEVAKAMKNLDIQQLPKALRYVGAATRFMASLLTQRNPEFWFTNLSRDLQGTAIQMNGTDAEGLQAKVFGNLPKAMAGMRHVARGTGKNTKWARYAQELKDAGGTTGYMQIFDNSTERMENLQKEVDRMGQGKADPRRLGRSLIEFIDDYNDVIENGVRLAVFQAARESGVSTQRAASIAKNITVNFNRKGNASPWVNSLYMFFNAGVQGTARLSQALATSNKARAVVGGLAGAAFVMDIVNRALAGDDDETKRNRYDLINEFEKSRNWIIMGPDGKYVKVPLPLGFHIFHNAGRLLADGLNRKDPRNAAEYGWAFASTVLDAFNPMGNVASVGQLLAPSVLDPAVQLAENKNFMGGKVFKSEDAGFGKVDPRPAYQRYFETTPDFWKAASKTLNDISGGDKVKPGAVNIEPDILRHVWGAITGGPGRALDKGVDTAQATARGEKITPQRYPFAHRFVGEVGDRQRDAAYFEDLKRAARAKEQFDYFVKNGRRQEALEILRQLGEGDLARGRRVINEFELAKKDERLINRRLRQLQEAQGDDDPQQIQTQALKERRAKVRRRVLSSTENDDGE